MVALMEDISNGILKQKNFESLIMDDYYKVMWVPNGPKIDGLLELMDYVYKTVIHNELTTLKRELKVDREFGVNRFKKPNENYDAAAPLVLVSGSNQ